MPSELHLIFNRARLDDRQINELVGLSRGLIADGMINQAEVEYLQKWLAANVGVTGNPMIAALFRRVNEMLVDKRIDPEESRELLETLRKISGGDIELGETLKSTTLPLDEPPPTLFFQNKGFCFTGTFAFGCRKDCETAVEQLGATVGSLTKKTHYLVIGVYATESWVHSSYGRKIEQAVKMRDEGVPICLVGEQYWVNCLKGAA
jgi:NAD-dependent DNA ligase